MNTRFSKMRKSFSEAAAFTKKTAIEATKEYFAPVTGTYRAAKRGAKRLGAKMRNNNS